MSYFIVIRMQEKCLIYPQLIHFWRMHLPCTAVHYLQRPSRYSDDNQRNYLRITCCLKKKKKCPYWMVMSSGRNPAETSMANALSWDISILYEPFYDVINFTFLQLQVLIIMKTISARIFGKRNSNFHMTWNAQLLIASLRAFWPLLTPLMISSLFMHIKITI